MFICFNEELYYFLFLQIRAICANDFELACDIVKPSVAVDDLQRYTMWNQKFGVAIKDL
jgi:hypothetical protein